MQCATGYNLHDLRYLSGINEKGLKATVFLFSCHFLSTISKAYFHFISQNYEFTELRR